MSLKRSMKLPSCAFVKKEVIEQCLANEPTLGKKQLEPLKSLSKAEQLPFNVLEDHIIMNNEAEVHMHEADLWYCLEGEVEFVYGGELVNPQHRKNADGSENKNELFANQIKNGTKVMMKPGDWLWIPAGQPHQHNCKETGRLVIIKIPKKD